MTRLVPALPALALAWTAAAWPASAGAATLAPPPAADTLAQDPAPPPTPVAPVQGRIRVYLDCFDCFPTYLREEIDWVDFVRQPQDADLTLLSSSRETGGGGREVTLRFVGRGRYEGIDHEHRALTLPGEAEDTRRREVLRVVQVGLLDYLSHVGLPAEIELNIRFDPAAAQAAAAPVDDPWNLWVFSIRANGSYDAEETNKERSWQVNGSADRVTENWKISFGGRLNRRLEQFDLDEDQPFESRRHDSSFDWFVAKSLGPHWSLGFDGRVASSTFGNTEFSSRAAPTVEYSIFPYREYASRRLTIQYEVGVERARYNEVTLYGKLEETLARQELSARLDQRQPWGSLQAGAEFSQYLHDFGKYRVEVNGEIDLRIARGLSVNFDGRASRIRDQLSLPRRDASPEEVLLRLRQLQSGYQVSVSFGITYSFGSIFNNVVNPRFGGGGGNFRR